jgi:superfamily II DNA or RNA helicase
MKIDWSNPFEWENKDGETFWRRIWLIPVEYRNGFFSYWKKNKFSLWKDGFSVYKDEDGDWYLAESQFSCDLFRDFQNKKVIVQPITKEESFWTPLYNIKNKDGLKEWQIDSVSKLYGVIEKLGSAVDGSDLGTGKTFTAIGLVRELDIPYTVVCPKSVINQWNKVIKNHFNFSNKLKGVINYELLVRGRSDSNIASFIENKRTMRKKFVWKIPKNSIILWDEAHRLKNPKTKNSKVCIEAYKQGYKNLFLSATLASTPLELKTIGTCLKLFKGNKDYYEFLFKHGVQKGRFGLEFNNDKKSLKKIHKYIFEERGVRQKRDLIPNFPETEIIIDSYNLDEEDTKKINEIYSEMKKELLIIEQKIKNDNSENELTIRLRALQKTELIKIPLIEEMVLEGIESGMSVVVFLNFSASIDALAKRLNTTCIYDGRNEKERQKNIELFQSNKENKLITNIGAAREGLNLGDEYGGFPRLTIISPNDSAQKMKQCLGRVHRENSKSKSVQKLIYISDTAEENVVENVKQKMNNIELINDGDLKI